MWRCIFIALFFIGLVGFPAAGQSQGFSDSELVEAAKAGSIVDAREAILLGQSPNIRSRGGMPALVVAAENGNLPVLRFLLEKSAKPDMSERKTGKTALIAAAEMGHGGLIEILLKHGADPNLPDRQGETPLIKAVRSGSQEAVGLLLAGGADVNASDYAGHMALWHARDARNQRIVQQIQDAGNQ